MIIACPECTSPFQVLDDQIAALLQVECPTCSFRMILDFAAANDASLREPGMQMANGFRDEATYRQAVGAGDVAYTPSSRPEPRTVQPPVALQPEPPRPEPQPQPRPQPVVAAVVAAPEPVRRPTPVPEPVRRPTPTPAPQPAVVQQPVVQQPVVQPQPEPQIENKPPVRARPTLIAHTAPPPVRQPPTPQPLAEPRIQQTAEARIETHVGPAPTFEPATPVQVTPQADDAQLEVPGDEFAVDMDESNLEPEVPVQPRTKPRVKSEPIELDVDSGRKPPHTPTSPSTTKPAREDEAPDTQPETTPETTQPSGGGLFRKLFMALVLTLLVGAAGLMGWAVFETGDWNPMPLLKDKFGLDLGFGLPPADAKPADAKSDAKAP